MPCLGGDGSRVGPIGCGRTLRRGEGRDGGSGSAVGREAPGRRRVARTRARVGRSPGAPRGARGGTSPARSARRAPRRVQGFFPVARRSAPRGGVPGGAVDRRAIAVASARAWATSRARRPLRSSRGRGRTRSRRVGSATPPARGARPGKAVARPGASAQPTAEPQKGEKSARVDSGKPSREGGARPRAPQKRESTSRARLRVDRVYGRARLRSATPVLTRATDRATHPIANLLPRGTSPRARRARAPAGESKTHRQTVSFICTPPKFDRPMADTRWKTRCIAAFFLMLSPPHDHSQHTVCSSVHRRRARSCVRSTVRSTPPKPRAPFRSRPSGRAHVHDPPPGRTHPSRRRSPSPRVRLGVVVAPRRSATRVPVPRPSILAAALATTARASAQTPPIRHPIRQPSAPLGTFATRASLAAPPGATRARDTPRRRRRATRRSSPARDTPRVRTPRRRVFASTRAGRYPDRSPTRVIPRVRARGGACGVPRRRRSGWTSRSASYAATSASSASASAAAASAAAAASSAGSAWGSSANAAARRAAESAMTRARRRRSNAGARARPGV